MKIFNKLIVGFFIIASIILLTSLIGAWNIDRVNNSLNYVTTKTWLAANSAMQISIDNLTRILGQEEYIRGNRERAKQWIIKSEESLFHNFRILKETGLADEKMISNIRDLYDKLDNLQKHTLLIYNQRNKTKLQLDENTIICTKTIEKLKYNIDNLKVKSPTDHQEITGKIIDVSILSLSERAAINNFLSGFLSETEYAISVEGPKSGLKRRLSELGGFASIEKDNLQPLQTVHIETERLMETLFNQHRTYKHLQTELSFNTLRLVESLENIKDLMNAKMTEAAAAGKEIAQTSQKYLIIFTIFGFLSSLIVGVVISKVITRPIIKLTSATERIAKGHLQEKVSISSKDEIGSLGNSFNRMTDEIASFTEEIKTKNIQLEQGNVKLVQANKELNAAIDELQIKTVRLNALNEELQKASRLKSEFLANMGHELRTPLNSIIGFTKLVSKHADRPLGTEDRNNLSNVLASAEQLLKLISDILDLSKIEAGKMQTHAAPFDLGETVYSVISMVKPIADEKRLQLNVTVSEDLPRILSDQDKIRQILINLIGNSVKFTEKGSVAISAKRVLMDIGVRPQTDCAFVSVADTGIGISEKDRRIIFEDFCQADGSITRKYGGTGLGLSISKKLANIIGGDINFESSPGKGSTFNLFFPIDFQIEYELNKMDKGPVTKHPGFKTTLLVIDDNREFAYTVEKLLSDQGFTVVHSVSGDEGVAKAKALMPDIITVDILLPGKSGWDVIKELKADHRTRNIPIIVISIVDKKDLLQHAGFDEYLQKPFARENLLSTLGKFTYRSRKTILVVDRDLTLFEKIKGELTKEGIYTTYAADGKSGIELLERHKPVLVLLDADRPEVEGYYFLHEIKSKKEFLQVPVIIFSTKEFSKEERDKLERITLKIIKRDETTLKNISGEILITLKTITR